MGFFTKIFKKKEAEVPQAPAVEMSQECIDLLRLKDNIDTALSTECYIARSKVADLIPEFEAVVNHFEVLRKSGMMAAYCEKNGLSLSIAESTLEAYHHLYDLLDSHNESYIQNTMASEKTYLDNILREVDPQIMLDDDQRRVVLTDEDYCLVIAGAGAGKTTTVAAKVKYLVEKKNVDPSQILVVSFTNKAVQELRDKLNRDLKIDCPIATFHSTGNAILRKKSPEKLNIVDDSKLYFVIQDYFKKSILKNESMVNNLILFFASYFDAPYEGQDLNAFFNKVAKTNFATLRSDLNEFRREIIDTRTKKSITIQSEVLRSHQEVEIANFLYLNGIDYEYEPLYKYDIALARKPYTPDFLIRQGERTVYLEHFGISQDGKNNRFSDDELHAYKQAINDKVLLHKQHGTSLIYTFSRYTDGRPLLEHLQEELLKKGFSLTPRSNKEVLEKLGCI